MMDHRVYLDLSAFDLSNGYVQKFVLLYVDIIQEL